MTTRICVLALLALVGCGRKTEMGVEVKAFPAQVEGGYKLTRTFQVPAAGAPKLARNLGLRGEARGLYEGPRQFTVVIYQMGSDTTAFELMQKWPKPRPADADPKTGKGDELRRLYFHKGIYFVVVETTAEDPKPIQTFTAALQRVL
jgi:hypothetical protein